MGNIVSIAYIYCLLASLFKCQKICKLNVKNIMLACRVIKCGQEQCCQLLATKFSAKSIKNRPLAKKFDRTQHLFKSAINGFFKDFSVDKGPYFLQTNLHFKCEKQISKKFGPFCVNMSKFWLRVFPAARNFQPPLLS
jgi:hypothetical protein